MRIEWAMACEDVQTDARGDVLVIGRPIDTTWTDEIPDDFDIPVVLCIQSEDDLDGGSNPLLRYEVRDDRDKVVGEHEFTAPTTVLRDGEWPATAPVRYWTAIVVRWRVSEAGFYRITLSLGAQPEPVHLGHLVLADD